MAFTATFTANFDAFDRELAKADVQLGKFQQNADTVKKSLQRMTSEFDGTKIISQANTMAEAVKRAGGASTLTASQMSRVSAAVNEALEKYQRMGQQAPAHLRVLQDQIKQVQDAQRKANVEAEKGTKQTGLWGGAFGSLKVAAAGFVAGFGVERIVSGLASAAARTIEMAGTMTDLSARTNISTTSLQRWKFAAEQNGNTIDELVQASGQLANRIGEGDKSTVAAIAKLGLNFETLKNQKPEQTFEQIASRLARVGNAYDQASLAQDLFGKGGQIILPTLKADLEALGDEAERLGAVLDQETLEAMDQLGDSVDKLSTAGQGLIARLLTPLVPLLNQAADGMARLATSKDAALEFFNGVALLSTFNLSGLVDFFDAASKLPATLPKIQGPTPQGLALPAPLNPKAMDQAGTVLRQWEGQARKASQAAQKLLALQDQLYGREAVRKASEYARAVKDGADVDRFSLKAKQDLARVMLDAVDALERNGQGASAAAQRYRELAFAAQQATRAFAGMAATLPTITVPPELRELMAQATRLNAPLEGRALPGGWGTGVVGLPGTVTGLDSTQRLSFFQSAFGNPKQFGAALTTTIMGAFQGGGNVGQAVGGLIGGGVFGELGKRAADKIGGFLGGAIGSIIPGLGTLIGGGLGKLAGKLFGGLFGGDAKKTREMRDSWLAQAGGIAEVRKMADYAGVSVDKLLSTKKSKEFEKEVKKLEAAFKATQERVQKLVGELQTLGQQGGLVTTALWTRLGADASKDEVREALKSFAAQQTERGIAGITDFVAQRGALLKALDEALARGDRATADRLQRTLDGLALTEQRARAVGATIAGMAQALEEQGATPFEAIQQLGPTITAFNAQLGAAGLGGGEAFDRLLAMATLAGDEIAGPVLSATTALGQSMVSLQNLGLMNQDTFSGLTSIITDGIQSLIAQGHSAETVIGLNRQGLQQIWQMQREFGFEVDEVTQSLLDQAVASGQVGEKFLPPIERLIARLEDFISVLTGGVTSAAQTAAGGLVRAFDGLRMPTVRVPIEYETGAAPNLDGLPSFARGSFGLIDFGKETLAKLHGKEAVLTEAQLNDLLKGSVKLLSLGGLTPGTVEGLSSAIADLLAQAQGGEAWAAAERLAAQITQRQSTADRSLVDLIREKDQTALGGLATAVMPWFEYLDEDTRSRIKSGMTGKPLGDLAVLPTVPDAVADVITRALHGPTSTNQREPGAVTLDVTINALDSKGVRDAMETQIVPSLVELLRKNFGGARTEVRGALGVA